MKCSSATARSRYRAFCARVATLALAIGAVSCKRVTEPTSRQGSESVSAAASAAPVFPAKESLLAVWGASRDDVWVVGDKGAIVHFDGHAWKRSESGTKKNLSGVHGTGAADVWAVGEAGTIVHFDGNKWTLVNESPETTLLAVRAFGPKDVWVTGADDDN